MSDRQEAEVTRRWIDEIELILVETPKEMPDDIMDSYRILEIKLDKVLEKIRQRKKQR